MLTGLWKRLCSKESLVKKSKDPVLHKDFRDFIELCNRFEVSIHGYPRGTDDLDICVEATKENSAKLAEVIKEFGLGSLGLTGDDFLVRGEFTQLGRAPVRIDVMVEMDEVPFEEAWQNRRLVEYQGQAISFIGYNELLRLKALAGRPQDIADIEKLKRRNKED